jgi:hypothetical protein
VVLADDTNMMDDGWVIGKQEELLFWVPPSHQENLWRPGNSLIIGENVTKVDFGHFVHGESWQRCYAPL